MNCRCETRLGLKRLGFCLKKKQYDIRCKLHKELFARILVLIWTQGRHKEQKLTYISVSFVNKRLKGNVSEYLSVSLCSRVTWPTGTVGRSRERVLVYMQVEKEYHTTTVRKCTFSIDWRLNKELWNLFSTYRNSGGGELCLTLNNLIRFHSFGVIFGVVIIAVLQEK